MQSSINQSGAGRIAYTVDGREASRAETFQAWQGRTKSEAPRHALLVFSRAEDADCIGRYARDCLARHGIGVHHLSPSAAVAHANGARLDSLIVMASAATAPTAQVRP